jgi:hypothetical protein
MLWRYCDTLIFQEPLTQPHSLTSQKTWILSSTSVRTLGLKFYELLKECAWETSFSPWSLMCVLHWSAHEQSVCCCTVIIQSMNSLWQQRHSVHELCYCSVIQSINNLFVTAVSFSPWTLWPQCHSVHEQSVTAVSFSPWTVCDRSIIQFMKSLFVTAVS